MSSKRVICEKIKTREPFSFKRFSSLSSSTSLPLFSMRCSPAKYGGPGSAPWNKYGWLQHLRNCITMFSSLERSPPLFTTSMSFCNAFL